MYNRPKLFLSLIVLVVVLLSVDLPPTAEPLPGWTLSSVYQRDTTAVTNCRQSVDRGRRDSRKGAGRLVAVHSICTHNLTSKDEIGQEQDQMARIWTLTQAVLSGGLGDCQKTQNCRRQFSDL